MKRIIILLILINTSHAEIITKKPEKKCTTSFAIIVDSQTYLEVGAAITAYKKEIENTGLSTYVLIENWQHPEEIKEVIIKLYQQTPPLEGVVFIGDVPIPMLRDAQHLTSAFKMDQEGKYSFKRSSVPSDRFYEDFDLQFTYLKQDSSDQLLFYFSLNPESPQYIKKEIYSARIFPPVRDSTKYKSIRQYLERIVAQKQDEQLSHIITFSGHGYRSESLTVWEGDLRAQREQFPELFIPGAFVKNYYHTMSSELKQTILSELQTKELDLAIFHAHGGVEAQYLLGNPPTPTIGSQVDAIKLFIRGKLRDAKKRNRSVEQVKNGFIERYDIPSEWFDDAFADTLAVSDSVLYANMDIYVQDIEKILPQAELLILDECFNGAFIHEDYVAGKYVFGNGATVAAIANSVNVLQDVWADEFLGLLKFGIRIGLLHRFNCYLESHIIGDPIFHFKNEQRYDINYLLTNKINDLNTWKSMLKNEQVPLRNIAVYILNNEFETQYLDQLLELYFKESSFVVRMQIFQSLARARTETFEKFLFETIEDPYELIRRKSVSIMGDIGKEEYIPLLVKAIFNDPSKRVRFNAQTALSKIVFKKEHIGKYLAQVVEFIPQEKAKVYFDKQPFSRIYWLENEIFPAINNDSLKIKKRLQAIRYFRNFRYHSAVSQLINIAKDTTYNSQIRISVLEALGWFTYSFKRLDIINACDDIINNEVAEGIIKSEALKTKNRLLHGANNPLTP